MDTRRCPRCSRLCYFRRGVHFEHQRRCGECRICWDPTDEEEYRALLPKPPIYYDGYRDGLAAAVKALEEFQDSVEDDVVEVYTTTMDCVDVVKRLIVKVSNEKVD